MSSRTTSLLLLLVSCASLAGCTVERAELTMTSRTAQVYLLETPAARKRPTTLPANLVCSFDLAGETVAIADAGDGIRVMLAGYECQSPMLRMFLGPFTSRPSPSRTVARAVEYDTPPTYLIGWLMTDIPEYIVSAADAPDAEVRHRARALSHALLASDQMQGTVHATPGVDLPYWLKLTDEGRGMLRKVDSGG